MTAGTTIVAMGMAIGVATTAADFIEIARR
jgi:hypothetical protein